MQVGILTFSAAHNFGASLQCYGLYSTLEELGHDVTLIDYCPKYLAAYKPEFGWRQFASRHFKTFPVRWNRYRYWKKIYEGYEKFKIDNLRLTDTIHDKVELEKVVMDFDYVVIGSDQIWNPQFNDFDSSWFADFKCGTVRSIAYAASAGNPDNLRLMPNYKCLLKNFSVISVRESNLARALRDLANLDKIPVVLDPSLLADVSTWNKWDRSVERGGYIVTYQARESDDVFRVAENISEQLGGARIVPLDFYGNVTAKGYTTRIADPTDFISLIRNARCVITTSFHGTAFSIILKTPFYTLSLNDGADNRSEELLKSVGLENRMIEASETPIFSDINFTAAHYKLDILRQESLQFLKSALK